MFPAIDLPPIPPVEQVQCYLHVAATYRLPASLLPAIAQIEGGKVGQSSTNKNRTQDHGPMQINDIWVEKLKPYGVTTNLVRDNFCASVKVAGYILRHEIDLAGGDFWKGVGHYHSRTPSRHVWYVQKVFSVASQLEPLYRQILASMPRRSNG